MVSSPTTDVFNGYYKYGRIANALPENVLDEIYNFVKIDFQDYLDSRSLTETEINYIRTGNDDGIKTILDQYFKIRIYNQTIYYHIYCIQDIEPEDNPLYYIPQNIINQMKIVINNTKNQILNTNNNISLENTTNLEHIFLDYIGCLYYIHGIDWIKEIPNLSDE